MKEPKISEIENLINHFRKTGREKELEEALIEHNISNSLSPAISSFTHELNPEMLLIQKIRPKPRTEKFKNILKIIFFYFREKWYIRYGIYYILLFGIIFFILNAPIILNSIQNNYTKDQETNIISYQTIEQQKMDESAPLDEGEVVPPYSQIIIPKINVTAPIIFLNTNDERAIQENLTKGVVHYYGTAEPGEVGNTFITGHSSNFWWIKGNYNYIFLNLNKLALNDQVKIYHKGRKFVYAVREIKTVEATDTSVLAPTDTPTLTLMTCTPPGTNWKRLIVKLDQIAPVYYKPRIVTKQEIVTTKKLPSTDTNSLGGVITKIWEFFKEIFTF